MRFWRLTAVLLAIAGLIGCGSSAPTTVHWRPYSSAQDGFSVLLPGTPKVSSKSSTENGVTITETSYDLTLSDDCQYAIGAMAFPADLVVDAKTLMQEVLQEVSQELGRETRLKLVSSAQSTYAGHSSLDFELQDPILGDPYFGRMVLVGQRLYVLVVTLAASERDSGDARKFLDSLQFTAVPSGAPNSAPAAPPPATFSTTASPDAPTPANWTNFSAPEAFFAAQFPGAPTRTVAQADFSSGPSNGYDYTALVSLGAAKGSYTVLFHPVPSQVSATRDLLLEESWQSTYSKLVSREIYKRTTTFMGSPSIEFSFVDRHGDICTGRLIQTPNRVYNVMALRPASDNGSGDAERFLNSFRLLS